MMQEGNQKYKHALGIYVHVPFCSSTCDFCAFYQERPSKKKIDSYFLALGEEILKSGLVHAVDTVFIGGGTPGILKSEELEQMCELISRLGLKDKAEWTIELAPNEVTSEKLSALKKGGVNRISLGVQTFDSKLMDALGRKHGPEKVFRAYELIREMDFEAVNLDLIFGIPNQKLEDWESDMDKAVELQPDHLSTYCLTFEEDTALYHRLAKGELSIDHEREALFYEHAWEYLPKRGYQQYEISNYAKDGFASIHNLNTWKMNEWVGFGPSACSQYQLKRWKNPSNLEKWEYGVKEGFSTSDYEEFTELTNEIIAEDAILFGLRMNQGINVLEIADRFQLADEYTEELFDFFENLKNEGFVERNQEWIYLTKEGRIRADSIAIEIPALSGREY